MTTTHASGHGALFRPYQMGSLPLPNRIVMAPLTRSRADSEGAPSPLAPQYYAQRSSAGLIIAEATTISRQGTGYLGGPGLYTDAHVAGWRPVTDAVHRAGGRIFVQLFHVGRMSHPDFHEGALPVGPSAIAAGPPAELYDHVHPFTRPRALRQREIEGVVAQFRTAAERALAAGFDGVEVHAANGYLLDQFLQDGANQRTDRYGGTPVNRARLLREVTAAVIEVCGADRVGVRISPINPTNGSHDSDPAATYGQATVDLDRLGVVYLHVVEPGVNGTLSEPAPMSSPHLGSRFSRPLFSRTIIAASGLTARTGTARIQNGDADLAAYGKPYISNPDLPERFAAGAELTQPDRDTFYFGGAEATPTTRRSIAPARRGRPDRRDRRRSPSTRSASAVRTGRRQAMTGLLQDPPGRRTTMGLAWQQGPLSEGAAGRFLVPDPLPERLLYAEPLRRRMRVRFGGAWIADSEDVVLLHEPGRYPVAYFPLSDITSDVLQPSEHTTRHRDLGLTSWYTVRSGEHGKLRAAWQHTELPGYAGELKGRIAFAWRAMDAFYEEDERVAGHAADAYHRIDIRQTSRHLVVRHGEQVIADTTRPLALYESGFAPCWYVPRADVDASALAPAEGQTFCPYKGLCSYYDIGDAHRAGWSYEDAWTEVRRVSGLVSFEPDKIEVHLDGTRLWLEPGQSVIPHGVDRGLTTGEVAPGRTP